MTERLGWTLVHFLWQGGLIAAIYALIRCGVRGPNPRYLLACAALGLMLAAPFVTFAVMAPSKGASQAALPSSATLVSGGSVSGVAALVWQPVSRFSTRTARPGLLNRIVLVWLVGATAFWIRLIGGWWMVARMRVRDVRPAYADWQQTLDRLRARIGVSRPVRLLVSGLVHVPTVIGWLKPVVLVPAAALAGLPPEQIEALLAHELAHIRRHDYLINIVQSVAEALLFYHPAVWWVSRHIRTERELCCDDLAVSVSGDALTYACALAELEANRPSYANTVLAANGSSLADRIARLLGQSRPASRTRPALGVVVSAILLVAVACGVYAQSTARPKFETVTIKEPESVIPFGVHWEPDGRFTANTTLRMLMVHAYQVDYFQIVGGAPWVYSEHYQIEAKGPAEKELPRPLLQSLLEDQFHLTVHRETRELPVYELTMAEAGKLQQGAKQDCVNVHGNWPPDPRNLPVTATPPTPPCGIPFGGPSFLQGEKLLMTDLTRSLSSLVGRAVLDKTGFRGKFDVHLQYAWDATTSEGLRADPAAFNPDFMRMSASKGPSIVVALQEQLGLKLEPAKGPVDVLVIDHVERPVEN